MTPGIRPFLRFVLAANVILCLATACSKNPAQEALTKGNAAYEANQFDKADQFYRQALRSSPNNAEAAHRLGLILYAQGQIPQALKVLANASELEPDNLEIKNKFALVRFAVGDAKTAREIAQQILEKDATNNEALVLLVRTSIDKDQLEETERYLEKIARDNPQKLGVGYRIARSAIAIRKNDLAQAEAELLLAKGLNPKSAEVYGALGGLYWRRHEMDRAAEAFKTASELASPRSSLYLSYAEFKLTSGGPAGVSEAAAILQKVADQFPDHLPAHILLMKISCSRQESEQQADCAKRAQAILAKDPTNYDGLFYDGLQNMRGDVLKSVREFEFLSSAYARNWEVRYQAALAHLAFAKTADPVKSGQARERAETRLREAISLNPKLKDPTRLLALMYLDRGNSVGAIDLLEKYVQDNPGADDIEMVLASAYLKAKNSAKALAIYQRVAQAHPKEPLPEFMIGTIFESTDETAARNAFEKSYAISHQFLPAVEKLVDLDLAKKQPDSALQRIVTALETSPKSAQLLALKGKVELSQEAFSSAKQDLRQAIEIEPALGPAYLLLARAYSGANEREKALETLNEAVAKHVEEIPALMELGRLYETADKFEPARDAYEKVLKVNAGFAPAMKPLAKVYVRLGDVAKAYALTNKAREFFPSDDELAVSQGILGYRSGDFVVAANNLQKVSAKRPNDPEVLFYLGQAYLQLKQWNSCRDTFERAQKVASSEHSEQIKSGLEQCVSALAKADGKPEDEKGRCATPPAGSLSQSIGALPSSLPLANCPK